MGHVRLDGTAVETETAEGHNTVNLLEKTAEAVDAALLLLLDRDGKVLLLHGSSGGVLLPSLCLTHPLVWRP